MNLSTEKESTHLSCRLLTFCRKDKKMLQTLNWKTKSILLLRRTMRLNLLTDFNFP